LPWYVRYTLGPSLFLFGFGERASKNKGERLRLALEVLGPIFSLIWTNFSATLIARRRLIADWTGKNYKIKVPAFFWWCASSYYRKRPKAPSHKLNSLRNFLYSIGLQRSKHKFHTANSILVEGRCYKVIVQKIEKDHQQAIWSALYLWHTLLPIWVWRPTLRPVEVVTDYGIHQYWHELDPRKEAQIRVVTNRIYWIPIYSMLPQVYLGL